MLTSLRHHATTLAICATFATITIAGSATAAALITGADIKNNTVSSADIKDQTLKLGDLSAGAAAALQGEQGPRGRTGETGPAGPAGPAGTGGSASPTGIQHLTSSFPSTPGPDSDWDFATGQVTCPAGKYVIADGHAFTNLVAPRQEVTLVADTPISTTGSGLPNAVTATATTLVNTFTLVIDVYCANIPA